MPSASSTELRAASLFGVLVLAKALALAGHDLLHTPWAPAIYLWQDAAVALVFAATDRMLRRPKLAWCAYSALVVYAAVNVPVVRLLATPLTWPMLHATDSALGDSIARYAQLPYLALFGSVVVSGGLVPLLLRRLGRGFGIAALATAAVLLAGGIAAPHERTAGLHRTAVAALWSTAWSRVRTTDVDEDIDWRRSPIEPGVTSDGEDLGALRGCARGRDVVLVVLESTAASALHSWGAPDDPMPELTRLARRSLRFENTYCVYPESIKGLVALQHAVHPAPDTAPADYAVVPAPSLARVLRAAGYRTALFHSGLFEYLGMEKVVTNRGYDLIADAARIGGPQHTSFGVDERATVRAALSWLDDLAPGDRFFLSYLPIAGHHPYDSPEPGPFDANSESGAYRNALHHADRSLGDLVRGLQERNRLENTVLAVVGDHGQAFGEHRGNYGHTFFLYEENVRVPLLFVLPGILDHEIEIQRVASHVDVAPTLLDLLDLPEPPAWEGNTLLQPTSRMALMFTDYSLLHVGLRDGPWKLIHEVDGNHTQLFDLRADPGEQNDVATSHVERVAHWRQHALRWASSQRARMTRRQRTHGNQ